MTYPLSRDAADTLIDTGTNRQGATISDATSEAVVHELQRAGLIGEGYGLTRKGTIERDRLVIARMDTLFTL